MKLYQYILCDTGYDDTGHVVAASEEEAKAMAYVIAEDSDYFAVFVNEVKLKGYKITVDKEIL